MPVTFISEPAADTPRHSLRLLLLSAFSVFSLLLTGCSGTTSFFFYPDTRWYSTPADVGQPYKNILLTAADGTRIHAWWLPARSAPNAAPSQQNIAVFAPELSSSRQAETKASFSQPAAHAESDTVVLYLHGNAQNISTHSHSIYWLGLEGVDVLALDYRGFGASQGEASLPEVMQDIEAAAQWLRQRYPDKRLILMGQSIGASLAVFFTAHAQEMYQIDALILDAPFAEYAGIAREVTGRSVIGWLIWPFTVLVPGQWDPEAWADQIRVPVLIMHSPDDAVIPYRHGLRVYQALKQADNPEVCWLQSRGVHIESFKFADLRQATLDFIRSNRCPDGL